MATVHSAPSMPHTLPAAAAYFPPPRRSGSALQPPSVSFGDVHHPSVELHKPVWVIDSDCFEATVTGEIEVNTSLFPRGAAFAIGIELKSPDSSRSEWNHDGPNNRPSSFIQLAQRLTVDETAFTTVTLSIPQTLLPASQQSRVFTLSCCAFLLSDPRVKTEMSVAKFMVVRRAPAAPTPVTILAVSVEVSAAPCQNGNIAGSRGWMGRRRVAGGWGKVGKW
ncbi:hypothetical protein BDV93DRAFT_518536 [Ceratobasidium sp. AG-I]|nr:hypothetical protein BDV93DRAFT_518536 [Ceratobasidium sp. AG-I]